MVHYEEYTVSNDLTNDNLIKSDMLTLFPNVTYLEFICDCHPIQLFSLLSIIHDSSINKIMIMDNDNTWLLQYVSSSIFTTIVDEYKKANFKLQIEQHDGTSLTITKV